MSLFTASSVAVLLFCRPAIREALVKPFSTSQQRDERAWQTLESLAWEKILLTQLPAFRSYELIDQSAERPFGEQLRRATQVVLDQNYDTVLCIGNDCPALRETDLRAAAQLTQLTPSAACPNQPRQCTLPMGTDQRGGVYLVGLNRAVLRDSDAFDALPWHTAQLAQALSKYLHRQEQWVAQLPATYRDWNTIADICLNKIVGDPICQINLVDLLKPVLDEQAALPPLSRSTPAQEASRPNVGSGPKSSRT